MIAVVYNKYGGPEVLEIVEIEKPSPKTGEVLVQVGASGINPVDTYFRSGARKVEYFPFIPHADLGGIVVEVGEGVTKWKKGDRVWGTSINGTAAEYVAAPEHRLFPLPEHLTLEEGAAIAMPFATAHHSLFSRGQLKKGETVLIKGASGAVGNAAVQLAKIAGATVIATASNDEKEQIAKRAGADYVINYRQTNIVEEVKKITASQGISLILEMSLSENMEEDLEMIEIGGRIVTIGSPKNNNPTLPWRLLNLKNASLIGIMLFTIPKKDFVQAGNEISKLFAEKKLTPHIGKVFKLEEAAKGHEALESKQINGNIILVP